MRTLARAVGKPRELGKGCARASLMPMSRYPLLSMALHLQTLEVAGSGFAEAQRRRDARQADKHMSGVMVRVASPHSLASVSALVRQIDSRFPRT